MTRDIKKHEQIIDKMSHLEMAKLWRFAPSGHLYFDKRYTLFSYFEKRFISLGGMTPQISKQIGWEK